jgi:hypothetical protein
MARAFLIPATVLAMALAAGAAPALAQSVEQQENRRLLRENQRRMEQLEMRRELDARQQRRALEDRTERDAIRRRGQMERIRPDPGARLR